MKNIIVLSNKSPTVTYWREEKTGKPARNEDGSIKYDLTAGGEGILSFLIDMNRTLDGEYGVKHLLHSIKNVRVTEEEFEKRKAKDDKIRENDFKDYDWDFENNPLYFHIQWTPEQYGDDILSTIPYNWGDGEVYHANSYADVTEVHNNDCTQVEYYSTPEVIEVLEKWIEALERWNNPEERKKMIEEYERDHTEEK